MTQNSLSVNKMPFCQLDDKKGGKKSIKGKLWQKTFLPDVLFLNTGWNVEMLLSKIRIKNEIYFCLVDKQVDILLLSDYC